MAKHRARLADARASCGCREGEITMLAGVAAYVAFLVVERPWDSAVSLVVAVALVLPVLFVAGGVGKLLGLGWARLQIRYHRYQLNRKVR